MRDASPTVSVVIPVYNGERYIADAIESVLAQTHRPLECIVVDDGSSDGTPGVIERFGSSVRYLRKDNGGVAAARNLGAASASGRYLALLDADDVWRPDKLREQVDLLAGETGLGLVYSGVDVVDEALRPTAILPPAPPAVALRNTLLLELPNIAAFGSTAVMPLGVFRALHGFDERLTISADLDLSCRIAARHPIACVPLPLARYRQHASQMHLNLGALEHDMLIVYAKLFGTGALPDDVNGLRRRGYANLYTLLAVGHLRNGNGPAALRCALHAVRHHPARLLVGGWNVCRGRLAGRA